MIPITNYVLDDEPAVSYSEVDRIRPDSRGVHRYETILIIRNWQPVRYMRDMGPASEYTTHPIHVIGGIWDGETLEACETVGTIREEAFKVRMRPAFDLTELVMDGLWAELTGRPDRLWFS